MAVYDDIGRSYRVTRRPDPRIASAIRGALGDATSVVNVGAGTGSYEPPCTILAVEPSRVMIDQRPASSAPAVQAIAESLPLADKSVDAALAVLTVHHWTSVRAGVLEMRRVARRRIVFFTWSPEVTAKFWLLAEYLPEAAETDARQAVPLPLLTGLLSGAKPEIRPVPIPHDCLDGFTVAYWRRPQAYLDPQVRAGMSIMARTSPSALAPRLARLEEDIRTGRWHETHAHLLDLDALDAGYCTVTIEL